jgi:hypothetical protein
MTATQSAHRLAGKTRNTTRPIPELLLELAYRLHATRAVRPGISRPLAGAGTDVVQPGCSTR